MVAVQHLGFVILVCCSSLMVSNAAPESPPPPTDLAERDASALLDSVFRVVSESGSGCGLSAPPLEEEGLLLNSSVSLIEPFLQPTRDACELLSLVPSRQGDRSLNPKVLAILWRVLGLPRPHTKPLGLAYFEANHGDAWLLYDSEPLHPSRYQLGANVSASSHNASLSARHAELAICLRKAALQGSYSSAPIWSAPYWDCKLLDWVLAATFPVPARGSLALVLPLQAVDVDQCSESRSKFGGSHRCDPATTKCAFQSGLGFRSGGYECRCLRGFFNPVAPIGWTGYPGALVEAEEGVTCVPCPPECEDCAGGSAVCPARLNPTLRGALLAVQSLCMGITVGLACAIFRNRKRKPIAVSMWTVLETILLGILLLYAAVVIRFFKPSVAFCLLETWCRELGFVICYGGIILKLYRILIEFRTRKAHRWVVRDKDLLKYLLGMVLIAVGYLAAHTATALHTMQHNPAALMASGRTNNGVRFPTCRPLWWDFVTQAGELGMLIFGMHLSIASRNASVQFHERLFLFLALIVEAVVSGVFYVLRAVAWQHLHPDLAFIAYVVRSQCSNTAVLFLLFIPKWWFCRQSNQQGAGAGQRLQPGAGEGLIPASPALGTDAELPEVTLADMNPEDIRAELKRLYTQLEVLKNKTIRADNPHISKRRGGRKQAHRRFSLQKKGSREKALHHRQKSSKHHHDGETEVSRTPEDSVCSVEGPSAIFNDGPSVAYSEFGSSAPRK